MVLLTLTGGAGAGKTTLAAALVAAAAEEPVRVLHGDDYWYAEPGRGVWAPDETGTPRLDVGDPRSIDGERLDADLAAALDAVPVVIVEGLFARRVSSPRARPRLDVFVDVAADLRLARKIERKCVAGDFPLAVLLRNYVEHRRDAHERHIEPLRADCGLTVDGTLAPEELARRIWTAAGAEALARRG
ncbi:hypothetical protein [Kitasatospora sp. MBT66]|uniref:hypothetical protein n=1 Tax=Kitasatospora sp. MBT66 TaxID=1444769 RepID=UPI000AF90FCF|nr:hypothetical protein [Kitasatospora sp. MBT66]